MGDCLGRGHMDERSKNARRNSVRSLIVVAIVGSVFMNARFSFAATHLVQTPPRLASSSKIALKDPQALGVTPRGLLLVMDIARDQILERRPLGKFVVFAGSGVNGFTGDGHLAVDAEVSIINRSGIAVAKNGTVYFSDSGNSRVRAILPNGIIETVAGGGTKAIGLGSLHARDVRFAGYYGPVGLAIAPSVELYIADDSIYRLGPDGILHWVVGEQSTPADQPPGCTTYSNPSFQNNFASSISLAFDGAGDLLVAGGGAFNLYEDTADGQLRWIEGFRAMGGTWGTLSEAPDGTVVLACGGLSRFSSSGSIVPAITNVAWNETSTALGGRKAGSIYLANQFGPGAGVVVAANSDIYVVSARSQFSSVGAIIRFTPTGHVSTIWRS